MPWTSKSRDVGAGDRVLVTGAAGGVGRHVVRALLDAGCDVRCVDMRPADYRTMTELIEPGEAEWIEGDLLHLDPAPLVDGCSAVIHCSAFVGLSETWEELAPSNVDLVEDLWTAANHAGVRHFIHFSTGSVYRPGRGLRSESDDVEPSTDYEHTKIASEEVIRTGSDDLGETSWTILRPAHIYGPHCESMGAGLVTLPPILRNFTPYLPGFTGGTRTSWVHVEDVAAAAMVVLGNRDAYDETYNVADDTPIGFGEALTTMTEAYGLKIGPLVPFPSPTFLMTFSPVVDREYTAATIRTVLRQLWKRIAAKNGLDTPLRPKVDRSVVFYVAEDTVLDNAALKALGWEPKYAAFADGIGETIRWYQDHGWVPRFDTESQVRLRDEADGVGFAFDQTITGSWSDQAGDDHAVTLTLEVDFPRVARGDLSGRINGTATFEELVESEPLEGTLEIAIFSSRQITYEFGFQRDGVAHRCKVQSEFSPLRPLSSLGRLYGSLSDQYGEEIGTVDLRLDLADRIVGMLTSFRLL